MFGENAQISRGKKSFRLAGKLNENIFVPTSLRYAYSAKLDENKSQRITGHVKLNEAKAVDLSKVEGSMSNIIQSNMDKINNCKNYDLVLICRGGGSTEDIKASFDHLELFDAMKNSKVPIITAIGHSDDDLIIDMVSDYKFTTPTEAGKFFYNIHVKQIKCIMDKCIKYINTCIEEEKIKPTIDDLAFEKSLNIIRYHSINSMPYEGMLFI